MPACNGERGFHQPFNLVFALITMKVETDKPFQIIYSLYAHEFLGYLLESFVVQLDEYNRLSFVHQNISAKNAHEFASNLDDSDYELIRLMDDIQQDAIIKRFNKKKVNPYEFFYKIFDSEKEKNKKLRQEILEFIEENRARILPLLHGKELYEMNNDGEPNGRRIEIMDEPASVLFHFRKSEENTKYFPTIKHAGEKIEFINRGAYLVCKEPAWMVLQKKLYHFKKNVDGHKLQPFLYKRNIVIPKKVEESYFRKFIAPLVASYDVYAKGFDIVSQRPAPVAEISFGELKPARTLNAFGSNGNSNVQELEVEEETALHIELSFRYNGFRFNARSHDPVSVSMEKEADGNYVFYRVLRNTRQEKQTVQRLSDLQLKLQNGRVTLPKYEGLEWISKHKSELEKEGFIVKQHTQGNKRYFVGTSQISVEVRENIDWFDIHTCVRFGDYEISFKDLRKMFINDQREITLPNGEVAILPESWTVQYADLFSFAEEDNEGLRLKKHHLTLIQELKNENLAQVSMDRKLAGLRNFEEIEQHNFPEAFKGALRPYQYAGYNWMHFLNQYKFGGCLADDMGLGKTVQTLAMLQNQKEQQNQGTSLLIMPTSLIYNWEKEAQRFTPELKVFTYTGTNRDKNIEQFAHYDLVLTSYGIVRLDVDLLRQFYFNYIILDESQAIKNPGSNITKAVKRLKARNRLILTGTPLENSVMDLWSQMNFINPGLLGSKAFFKEKFLQPIEKKGDARQTEKLHTLIKPFILRRQKWQVATELPEKVENVNYSIMTSAQKEQYEQVKTQYRNEILDMIETRGIKKSQFLLLRGLTKLRQIANHPRMVDPEYSDGSGKLEDVTHMLTSAISEGHKVLVFSQFVKHLALLGEFLEKEHIPYAYLDGSTRNRKEEVERFQSDENLRVFLMSLKAGGVGLNLTAADYVFILDPWWNPAVEAQATDRAHRIGQENKVFTYKFITKDSVEEKILTLQQNKLRLANDLITTEESFVKSLSRDDISAILN